MADKAMLTIHRINVLLANQKQPDEFTVKLPGMVCAVLEDCRDLIAELATKGHVKSDETENLKKRADELGIVLRLIATAGGDHPAIYGANGEQLAIATNTQGTGIHREFGIAQFLADAVNLAFCGERP